METQASSPIFFKNKDYESQISTLGQIPDLTPYSVCKAVERSVGNGTIDGAQNIRGIWRLYIKTSATRAQLLVNRNLRINDVSVLLYDQNPMTTNQQTPENNREKVTIKDLPLSVSNTGIVKLLEMKNVKLVTPIRESRERDPDGKLTNFKNGDRYVYCEGPIHPPLARAAHIAGLQCRIFHNGQFDNKCKACGATGHRAGNDSCPAFNSEDNVTCFNGHLFPLSNMFPCKLKALGKTFKSLEHGYQWWRANEKSATNLRRISLMQPTLEKQRSCQKISHPTIRRQKLHNV